MTTGISGFVKLLRLTPLFLPLTFFVAKADHKQANNCELFVDRVVPEHTSHGYLGYRIALKTINARLDAPIKRVVMHAFIHDVDDVCRSRSRYVPDCYDANIWQDFIATPFFGPDYFTVSFPIESDFNFERQLEAAFFVESTKGTYYWVNNRASTSGHFYLDRNGLRDVEGKIRARGDRGSLFMNERLDRFPKTADFYPYLNQKRCR